MDEPVPSPASGLFTRTIDGSLSIYNPQKRTVHVLNDAAGAVWSLLDGRRSPADLIESVAGQYDVDLSVVRADVLATLESFGRDGMLDDGREPDVAKLVYFSLAGSRIGVSVPSGSAAERLLGLLPVVDELGGEPTEVHTTFVVERGMSTEEWHLAKNGDRIVEGQSLYLVEKRLVSEFNRLAAEQRRAFSVHAGVVAYGEVVVAFPARSGGGKSTLVAACVQAGFEYVSDEALLLDYETALVLPYEKPIQLDSQSLKLLHMETQSLGSTEDDTYVSAGVLGGRAVVQGTSLRLRHVVVPRIEVGCTPSLTPLPRVQSVVALLEGAFNHYVAPERAFDLVHRLAEESQAWALSVGDPAETARLLKNELAGPATG